MFKKREIKNGGKTPTGRRLAVKFGERNIEETIRRKTKARNAVELLANAMARY